ncbi:MAG: hypothetical protein ACP5NX_03450 [Candidatus Bilamarchaeaceae archaeon]
MAGTNIPRSVAPARMLMLALFMLALSAVSFADIMNTVNQQTSTGTQTDDINKMLPGGQNVQACTTPLTLADLYTNAAIMCFAVVAFSVLLYSLANVLASPQLLATAKEELNQNIGTVVRIFLIFLIFGAAGTWFTVSTGETMIDKSLSYSYGIIQEISDEISSCIGFNFILYTVYGSTIYIGMMRTAFSFSIGPILKPVVDIFAIVIQFLSVSLGTWLFNFLFICTIKKYAFAMFIPLAILLRAVPPTRGAGDALLALMLALVVVYPITMVVNSEIHDVMKNTLFSSKQILGEFINETGLGNTSLFFLALSFVVGGFVVPFFVGSGLNYIFAVLDSAIYYVAIVSILMPFFNVFVTLTAAKEFAKFLNVDVNFMSFLKII